MKVSIVCPFYNEEKIIAAALATMLKNLSVLPYDWELIAVNDGSQDNSLTIANELAQQHERLTVVGYLKNRGRGYALRFGINAAQGAIVVTTEIDCSWGEHIVEQIVAAFERNPGSDIVIASPHLPGGGYRNVPWQRVLISRIGNRIVRFGLSHRITMSTGMTRGYRRAKFLALPLVENGKEVHLEIVNKAIALGYDIIEIPALLSWQKNAASGARQSSTKINKTINSHLLYCMLADPIRYFWPLGSLFVALSFANLLWGLVRLASGQVAIYVSLLSLLFLLLGGFCFAFGVLTAQLRENQKELWRIQSRQLLSENVKNDVGINYF
ncbi:MAG: glycosyltransferase family 2 protein [Chitinivibrionales bacterium]|nr:glycosyltransferase family 2 protein [Chitinivibrionales bacterium]